MVVAAAAAAVEFCSALYSVTFAHTAFSGAAVTDRAAIQPRWQQAKAAHTDFDLCCHTAARRP